jgi:hypothetical protein
MQGKKKISRAAGDRTSFWEGRALRLAARTFLLAGTTATMGAISSQGQTSVPDSQVEANVLKALASSPDLANQAISTNTVYGVVTLTGTVQDDALRNKAENLAANATGVKKVVDELQVGSNTAQNGTTDPNAQGGQNGMVLQSDGTYAPAQPAQSADASGTLPPGAPAPGTAPASGAVMNDPDHDQAAYSQQPTQNGQPAATGQAQPNQAAGGPPAYPNYPQNGYPQNGYPPQQGYPQNGYPAQGGYPQQGRYAANAAPNAAPWGGQVGGETVVVPAGTMVRIRVNRLLASDRVKPGDHFDGIVANDVVAGGFVAIPRGAQVQGTVVDAKSSGAISGRGELSLQLTSVVLGGKIYPVSSDVWSRKGPDKTGNTVGNAIGLGAVGALIGAVAGRGAGAAIGAGAGAAAGVGVSAAEPKGQVVIPPEGMLSFNLSAPATVKTVSEQEMQRLAYGVPPGQTPRQPMYARPYPGYYGYPPPPPPYGYPPY